MDSSADFLRGNFKTLNAGAEFVIDAFPGFYYCSISNLVGKFTENELVFFIHILNRKLVPTMLGHYLIVGIENSLNRSTLDFLKLKPAFLLKKVKSLSFSDVAVLEIFLANFWVVKDCGDFKKRAVLYIKNSGLIVKK